MAENKEKSYSKDWTEWNKMMAAFHLFSHSKVGPQKIFVLAVYGPRVWHFDLAYAVNLE